jgi:hypothetical protein
MDSYLKWLNWITGPDRMLKKFFSDSVIYAIGPQVPKLIGFLLLPILTKYLTAEDYAIWGIATAYIAGLNGPPRPWVHAGYRKLLLSLLLFRRRWKAGLAPDLRIPDSLGIGYTLILGVIIYFSLRNKVGGNLNIVLGCTLLSAFFFDLVILFGSRLYQLRRGRCR